MLLETIAVPFYLFYIQYFLDMLTKSLILSLSSFYKRINCCLPEPLSIGNKKRLLSIPIVVFVTIQSIFGQIAGPCGTTITITNASNPTAADGTITVRGTTGYNYYIYFGITGSEMYAEMQNTTATSKSVLTGLAAGTYTLKIGRELGTTWNCGWTTQTITVGSNAYATCAGTEIGGLIYHDANANGTREAGEGGAGNVTIRAYNAAGTLVNTQTSAATGIFKLTGLSSGQPYRLEYSWADSYLQSGAAGSGSGTSVQFVNSGVCTANFGINYPANYCQTTNPYVITPCYINGNPQAPAVAPLDVMVTFPYKASNHDWDVAGQNVAPTHVATASQIGATWSVAYQKTTKYAFAGAVMRRFAGFGPLGTGGIYKINMTTPTAPTVANWIDAKTIGINTGNDTRNATPANTLATAPGSPAWDAEAFNQVGKRGIGGMDFNDRGDTLWLMNLAEKKLYGIKNVNPSVPPTAADVIGGFTVSLPSGYACATNPNDFRPWAVKYYKGLVYVGAVCSGEATPWTPANMRGFVLSFDPKNTAAGFSYVTDFALDYTRYAYSTATTFQFQPWLSNATAQFYIAQPMVSDIEFDVDGAMILAVGDRGGLQSGNQNYYADPTATNTTLLEGNTYGDVLRFCKTGTTFTQSGVASCPNPTVNPFTYAEYYWGDTGPLSNGTAQFNELGAGSIAFSAGNGSILMTAQDAYAWYSGGIIALSNTSGGDLYRYVVYDSGVPGASGKATGLGDIEALCDPAPIEIGNRVWEDTDRDGIQDAGEAGLAGIQVQLYQGATLIGTTTTDANGLYKFTSLLPNTSYQVRVALGQVALASRPLSTTDVGSNGSDLIDNDMSKSGTNGIINFTSGYYGENNHTYDIGFEPNCNATVTATGSDNCVGATAILTATGSSSGSYSWSGPNSFSSTLQNPSIANVQLVNAGAYSVTFTKSNGCTATASAQINVNPLVSITTQPSPIAECIGGTQTLSVVAAGGFPPLTYQWQNGGATGASWTNIAGATTSSYTPLSTVAGTTLYRVIVSSTGGTGCASVTSNSVSVIVSSPSVGGTLSPATQTICASQGILSTALTLSGNTGTVVRWEYLKPGSGTWTDWGGAGSTTAPSNCCFDVVGTWQVRVVVQSGACAATNSSIANVIVVADPSATTSGGGTVCVGGSIVLNSTVANGTGTCSRQWQSSTDNINFTNIAGATATTYSPPTTTAGTRYYRVSYSCTGTNCDQAFSNAQTVIVNPNPTATATSNAPVSLGGTIILTSSGGGTYSWSGPNGFTSTNQNPVITPTTVNNYGNYTVTVTLNGCTATASTYVTLNCSGPVLDLQNPSLIGGTAGAVGAQYRFNNVTTGTDAILTIVNKSHSDIVIASIDEPQATNGGYDAAFQPIIDYNWINSPGVYDPVGEKSVTFKIDFVDAGTFTPHNITVLNMTAVDVDGSGVTNEIREFVQAGGYSGYQLQSPTTLTLSGTLKAKGQYANKAGVDETALDAMISYDYSNVNSITFTYGAEFGGAGITEDASGSDERRLNSLQFKCYPFNNPIICPSSNISISGGGIICSGGNTSLSASTAGGAGTCTLQWQSTTGTTWADIVGANTTTYAPTNLTTTTSYRAIYSCTGALCPADTSNIITVTVVADPSVSVAIDRPTICVGGTANLTATVSNGTGTTTYQWQYLVGSTWTNVPSAGTNPTYTATGTAAGSVSYRINITQTGTGCNAISSSTTILTVVADPSVSVAVNNSSVCVGGTATLTATVSNGTGTTTYQWQSSTDLLSWSNIAGATSSTYSAPTGAVSVIYYRVTINQTGSDCVAAPSNAVSVTVVADPSVTVSVPPAIVCEGANITLTATPTVGAGTCTTQWQSSPDGTTWTNISGATGNTYNVISLGATTRYRAQLVSCSGSGCCN